VAPAHADKTIAPVAPTKLTSMEADTIPEGSCMGNDLIDVVERSAIASARRLGRGDNNAADPLEGTNLTAKGLPGAISVPAVAGPGDHVTIGKGGANEGVISAAATKALGGKTQAKRRPTSQRQIDQCRERGIADVNRKPATDELVQGSVVFAAAGVTSGSLLKGVTCFDDGARTHAVIMCMRCNVVRFIDTIHLFAKDIHREIRLWPEERHVRDDRTEGACVGRTDRPWDRPARAAQDQTGSW